MPRQTATPSLPRSVTLVLLLGGLGLIGYVAAHALSYVLADSAVVPVTAVETQAHDHAPGTPAEHPHTRSPLQAVHSYQWPVLALAVCMICVSLFAGGLATSRGRRHVREGARELAASPWLVGLTGLSALIFVGLEFAEHWVVGAAAPEIPLLAIGFSLQVLCSTGVLAWATRVVEFAARAARVAFRWLSGRRTREADGRGGLRRRCGDRTQIAGRFVPGSVSGRGPPAFRPN